jgi:acetyl-CoA carboxylase carboxyltransferase component
VAGDPYAFAGCLTVEGAEAVTRLADLCSTFHLPVVTFTDQPGLLIGTRAEQRATIRHGVRAISAAFQSDVPGAEVIDPRETRPLLCDWVHDAYAALPASPGRPSFGTRP